MQSATGLSATLGSRVNIPAQMVTNLRQITSSPPAFILLDASMKPISFNREAIQVLTFSPGASQLRPELSLASQIRSLIIPQNGSSACAFATEFKSHNRRYTCRAFWLENPAKGLGAPRVALLLERGSPNDHMLSRAVDHFRLTDRECQVVELLIRGLSTKQIALRLKISPNTVKAFIRVVMVRMGVSSRSAVIAQLLAGI